MSEADRGPVLILAPPRSCSTVVTAMLGNHPEIFAFPEMKLFRRATVDQLLNDWPTGRRVPVPRRRAGLLRGIAQVHSGDQQPQSIEAALSWLQERQAWTGADVLAHLRAAVSPRLLIEKSPENCGRAEYLDRLLTAVPEDVRLLHLVRHPVKTAASLNRGWTAPDVWDLTGSVRHQFDIGIWFFSHRRIVDRLAKLPRHRWFRIRAEDVVNAPERHLPALCRWIGVDDSPEAVAAMRHTELWPFASRGPTVADGGGDPLFFKDPALRAVEQPAGVDIPSEWSVDPWTNIAVRGLAAEFGYC